MQSFDQTWIEEGRKKGRKEGLEEGRKEGLEEGRYEATVANVLRVIHHRFGILESETEDRIRLLPLEKLEQLIDESFNFTSRDDLITWLLEDTPMK